jgi:hypothetical protein
MSETKAQSVGKAVSRRGFLKTGMGAATTIGFPTIVLATILGQLAPSKRINGGPIGVGRISRVHAMPGILQFDRARIVAVCDLDAHRMEDGKKFVNDFYTAKTGKSYDGVTGYLNYHDLPANKDIGMKAKISTAIGSIASSAVRSRFRPPSSAIAPALRACFTTWPCG